MKFYYAPMESITIYLYRNIYEKLFGEIDKYYTPFIMPNGKRTFKTREFQDVLPEHNEGLHIVPQILTKSSKDFIRTAKELKELGYDEVNLNLGCPSRTVVAKQKGSGFLREPEVLDDFLTEIFDALDMKISIKTRIGLRDTEEFEEILSIYNRHPVYELTIHPRLQQEFYKGKPHLDVFEYAVEHSENPLCYNGDIVTKEDYDNITTRFPSIDAVMIGRGLLRNPALVREIKYGQKLTKRELLKMHDTLYEAYQAIAAAYHVPFVMQSIEPGERIYYNTDEAHLFFPDRYCVRLYEESLLTPCGLIIGEKLEDGEPFETETDVLERFRDCGYPAATLKELELMFDADELIIFEFTNPYLDLEQKNACA